MDKSIKKLIVFSFCLMGFSVKSALPEGTCGSVIQLKYPLVVVSAKNGFVGCGYIDASACGEDEACAIVSGVKIPEDVLKATVKAVSSKAADLGVKVGMSGAEALERFK